MAIRVWNFVRIFYSVGLFLLIGEASGQTTLGNLSFATASVQLVDPASGMTNPETTTQYSTMSQTPPCTWHDMYVDVSHVQFICKTLKDLIAIAYGVDAEVISGPQWLAAQQFNIVATLPSGASPADAYRMLQTLLETRFKLAVHRKTREIKGQQVMALVVAKGGPKLKPALPISQSIVRGLPPTPYDGEVMTPDGPLSVRVNGHEGSIVESSSMTMDGFVRLLVKLLPGGDGVGTGSNMSEYTGDWHEIVNRTELQGWYQVAVKSSRPIDIWTLSGQLSPPQRGAYSKEMLQMWDYASGERDPGYVVHPETAGQLDPMIFKSVLQLGLKLKLLTNTYQIDRLIVDHVEKMPTKN